MDDVTLRAWFHREVFPHEAVLTRLIRRHWRGTADVRDMRQDIYLKVYAAARTELPLQAKPFLLTIARNHLINELRRSQIVPIDFVTDLDAVAMDVDEVTPERHATARDELRRVKAGLEKLPPRCQEIMRLRRIEEFSVVQIAERLSVTPSTVESQLSLGTRALIDFMLGGTGRIDRTGRGAMVIGKVER